MANRQQIANERFVRAWQDAESPAEVGRLFGITDKGARSRATYLRKRGVPLKKFPTGNRLGNKRINTSDLSALAEKGKSTTVRAYVAALAHHVSNIKSTAAKLGQSPGMDRALMTTILSEAQNAIEAYTFLLGADAFAKPVRRAKNKVSR